MPFPTFARYSSWLALRFEIPPPLATPQCAAQRCLIDQMWRWCGMLRDSVYTNLTHPV
jgi:hypothetical protein